MSKKPRSPYFVSAELTHDGRVKLTDDDHEVFYVEMRRDQKWPLLSRQARNMELREDPPKSQATRPPTDPFKPRLIVS